MTEEENAPTTAPVAVDLTSFIEVKLSKKTDFLKVMETLTRMGIASYSTKRLIQSCHILHKKGKYYIVHFKELFGLDGKPSEFTEDDKARRNTIANLLAQYGLVTLVDPEKSRTPTLSSSKVGVIAYKDKAEWTLESKYTIGNKRRDPEEGVSRLYPRQENAAQ